MATIRSEAWQREFSPIILKRLCLECGISQSEIGKHIGISRSAVNLMINRGYLPKDKPEAMEMTEQYVRAADRASRWLARGGYQISDIWQPLGQDLRHISPAADNQKMWATRRRQAAGMNDPGYHIIKQEVEMKGISGDALKHFKLFRDPMKQPMDVQKDADIFMSEEHRYIEAAMIDAARCGGFLAVIGECGSGKSVMLRKVIGQLRKDGGCHIIMPRSNKFDSKMDYEGKSKLTPGRLIDAIICDISDQTVHPRLEQKARQMEKLLIERSQQGYQSILIIDEAHSLQLTTLKYLKRFWELEDGYKKMLGIVLVGQPEMKRMLNEEMHPELREVIRRIQVAEIRGLNGNLKDYLAFKFQRIKVKIEDVIDDAAIAALTKRLISTDHRDRKVSHAYPLTIYNYMAAAMNLACEMGEEKVTEGVVMALSHNDL